MPLDPVLAGLISALAAEQAALRPSEFDLDTARESFEEGSRNLTPVTDRHPVADLSDTTVPGLGGPVPVRVYRPASATEAAPVIVWLHGGGWTIGSLDTGDIVARALCHGAGAVVVSVDYRLAPENPWPAALEDAVSALAWVVDHAAELGGDAQRIAVGGDSAGGTLAAVVAQQARDTGPALAGQVLMYPATDLDADLDDRYPSLRENATGYVLTRDDLRLSVQLYLPAGANPTDPRISPAQCQDLTGLPPAVVAVAEFDPIRDQGVAYASALREAGVPTHLHRGLGLIHGCFDMLGMVPASRSELDRVVASVRDLLSPGGSRLAALETAGGS